MIDNKYAVVVVGFGGMGSWHRELITEGGLAFVGTYDIDPKVQENVRAYGFKAYDSLEDVLADKAIDLITIATPNDFHKEIAIKAMNAGKHVVCEKPVTLSSDDLQEMIDASIRNNVHFTVHQNRRWDEDYLIMKKIYNDNTLGEVFNIETRVHGSRGIPGDWRGRKAQGGGMMLDWGVHILDQLLQIVHERITSVYAKMTHVTNYEVDDGFKIFITFESGKTALAEVGTSNFISLPRFYMQGENGTAIIHDFSAEGSITSITDWNKNDAVPVKTAAGLTKTMAPRTDDTIKESALPKVTTDLKDFYYNVRDVIDGKAEPLIKLHEVMRVMKLMEAAFKSDETGQVVSFE